MDTATLAAVAECILPSGDGAGARETGVAQYLETTLREPYFHKLRGPIDQGLERIRDFSRERFSKDFPACSPSDQTAVLESVQAGDADTPKFPAHWFFEIFISLVLEAYLCDPARGGNRDAGGWKHIGYSPRLGSDSPCVAEGSP